MADNDIVVMPFAPPAEQDLSNAPATSSLPPAPTQLTPTQLETLKQQGFTEGTAQTLLESISAFRLRIWVIDNSGSMNTTDGHRLKLGSNGTIQELNGTRWKELQETMEYHIQLASLLGAPSEFRMLNTTSSGVNQFSLAMTVGQSEMEKQKELSRALQTILTAEPGGVTPLTRHIYEIRSQVELLAPMLRATGQKVTIILATDGLPSDDYGRSSDAEQIKFREALNTLEGLPIWIVIRLCTDNNDVVEYYNDLDRQLEFSLEVLDNYTDEAAEIHKVNPWLNYVLALHRMREMGLQNRIIDFLDERLLALYEVRDFCALLFGKGKMDGVPDPEADYKGFMKRMQQIIQEEHKQWHPVKKQVKSLISYNKLQRLKRR
jgi:hypothetical protein